MAKRKANDELDIVSKFQNIDCDRLRCRRFHHIINNTHPCKLSGVDYTNFYTELAWNGGDRGMEYNCHLIDLMIESKYVVSWILYCAFIYWEVPINEFAARYRSRRRSSDILDHIFDVLGQSSGHYWRIDFQIFDAFMDECGSTLHRHHQMHIIFSRWRWADKWKIGLCTYQDTIYAERLLAKFARDVFMMKFILDRYEALDGHNPKIRAMWGLSFPNHYVVKRDALPDCEIICLQ